MYKRNCEVPVHVTYFIYHDVYTSAINKRCTDGICTSSETNFIAIGKKLYIYILHQNLIFVSGDMSCIFMITVDTLVLKTFPSQLLQYDLLALFLIVLPGIPLFSLLGI